MNTKADSEDHRGGTNPALALGVKDLGRRARERLQEERAKRREIVRLDTNEPLPIVTTPHHQNAPKRKRARTRSKPRSTLQEEQQTNIDPWCPQVTTELNAVDRSTLVRIHGLPRGCKPEDIRRFFSTLAPDRVIILPTMEEWMPEWDGDKDDENLFVFPRLASTFRVYINFTSLPLATLASSRTGEILYTGKENDKVGVKIAVVHVSKPIAKFIVKYMAIDAPHGTTLQETLQHVESCLFKSIPSLLWATAFQKLGLKPTFGTMNHDQYPWQVNTSRLHPSTSFKDYQRLVKLSNCYLDEYELLEVTESVLHIQEFDPTFRSDVLTLTQNAARILTSQIENLQERLVRARFELQQKHQHEMSTNKIPVTGDFP